MVTTAAVRAATWTIESIMMHASYSTLQWYLWFVTFNTALFVFECVSTFKCLQDLQTNQASMCKCKTSNKTSVVAPGASWSWPFRKAHFINPGSQKVFDAICHSERADILERTACNRYNAQAMPVHTCTRRTHTHTHTHTHVGGGGHAQRRAGNTQTCSDYRRWRSDSQQLEASRHCGESVRCPPIVRAGKANPVTWRW